MLRGKNKMGSRVEKHLSRIAMPKSWQIKRKGYKWVARPMPGAHTLKMGIPLVIIIRDIMNLSQTARETKKILNNKEVFVDGIVRKNPNFVVGVMDVITIPSLKKYYRVLLSSKGKMILKEISAEESRIKPCKIKNKTKVGKRMQLNLNDGKNVLVDKDEFKCRDTVILEIPANKIKEIVKFEKGSIVYLIGGKNIGSVGKIEDIKKDKIVYKKGNELFETLKEYAFAVGKHAPLIKIE